VAIQPFELDAPVYVAGHNGLVGSAVWRRLAAEGFTDLVGWRSADVDLRDRDATFDAVLSARPAVVVLAAAKVGGILANSTYPVDFLNDNLRIQTNVFEAAHAADVPRLLFLGSSCIYPKHAPQPISESSLLTGPLEPTNDAYAIAKISGIIAMKSYRAQYGRTWISAMPTNLYGPGDNFDLTSSHVLPAMIRKFHEAKASGGPVTLWGTGSPLREFLHVDDLADAVLHLLREYDSPETINVGVGSDVSIRELAETIADVVGYDGETVWDTSKPDGTPRKLLDTSKLAGLAWQPQIGLRDGIAATYQWYLEHAAR
jgi:GDP-L-fucose synthase